MRPPFRAIELLHAPRSMQLSRHRKRALQSIRTPSQARLERLSYIVPTLIQQHGGFMTLVADHFPLTIPNPCDGRTSTMQGDGRVEYLPALCTMTISTGNCARTWILKPKNCVHQ